MHLELTNGEFERLLKMAYLGEVMLSDWTPPGEMTAAQQQAVDLLYDLCERAATTPARKYVTQDAETGDWVPSDELKAEMDAVIRDYDNDVFWDELVFRLAYRELMSEYGREALERMPYAYRSRAQSPLLDHYWKEVRAHGMDRLVLEEGANKTTAPKSRRKRKKQ